VTGLSPFQGLRKSHSYPGLAPWAALFRRYAPWFEVQIPRTEMLGRGRPGLLPEWGL